MSKHIAIYVRVSSKTQHHRSQLPDLERWGESQNEPIKWYKDKASGKSMNRPGWNELESNIQSGSVSQIVVWKLDRLGRTASGLTSLFDKLLLRNVNLVSIKDCLDLSTSSGRLMANVLASVAQYDNEVRSERQAAGIAKARSQGKKWGGSKKGTRTKVTADKMEIIRHMRERGKTITGISRAIGLSRPTIYQILKQISEAETCS